ncbi:MAG: hypothetical protein JWM47_2429 [Acidimicrobiales bacterium]|nr:hypothetical protein [Acidimicrobiales bacterium]
MEIVIRAAAVYVILWVVLRAMGKRELSEMTAFELVILVVLGDIIQQGVTQEDMSVTGAGLAVCTMAMLAVGSSVIGRRFPRSRSILEGRPSVVVRGGVVQHDVLREQRMTIDEVHEAARKRGSTTLTKFAWVIVEPDGKFSFIEHDEQAEDDTDEEGEPHT